ncbi:MAG: hypothetical protein A4S09_06350 [Proteobacteria bacterium SG_bin7]|nr:MAG: hypothetical protein A4S09_06350 [Proteobacteria bacterium SG_bin7]
MKQVILNLSLFFASILFHLNTYAAIWTPLPPEAYRFGREFQEAQNLLFAFDYGHALLYEKLISLQGVDSIPPRPRQVDFAKIEDETLKQVFQILKNPPNQKVDEEDIAPQYTYYFSWLNNIFDWSHLLHQFAFDIMTTYPGDYTKIQNRIQEIGKKYSTNSRVAIPMSCRSMDLMDGHYYSKEFRKVMPRYNQLIWSYHWFQMKLYDDMLLPTRAQQKVAVKKSLDQFWQLVSNLPTSSGFEMMPMASEVAPNFYKIYPQFAWSFDANHMAHDIINDILVSSLVSVDKKAQEGFKAAQIVLDKTKFSCSASGDPEIVIEGQSDGTCKPDVIHLTKGKKVELVLKAANEMFVLKAPDLEVDLMSMPGQPSRKSITPTKTGTFPFTCGKHGGSQMNGQIMVM